MRNRRDWSADIAFFVFAVVFSLVTADSVHRDAGMSGGGQIADQVAGGLACASVFLRRRWPVQSAVLLMLAGTFFHYLTGATLVALFTVAVLRRRRITARVAAVALVQFLLFLARGPDTGSEAAGSALAYFALVAGAIGWGLYVRSRRALVASLEDRAARAAADARRLAREEIAREMHDVLAHRLSLLSVHAGALEFNPGAPAADIRHAAGVIRDSAHQALQDLREVIGVLRAPTVGREGAEGRPQPTLVDVGRLVAESRRAGMGVIYQQGSADADTLPAVTGRTAYRIVQEGLTNARKHAPDSEIRVAVAGRPGEGLTVAVTNPLPAGAGSRGNPGDPGSQGSPGDPGSQGSPGDPGSQETPRSPGALIPGAGQGLIGLGERAQLAGGRLEYGPRGGSFVLRAWLPWDGTTTVGR